MPQRDVLAAEQALHSLSRVTGRFSKILTPAGRVSVTVDGVLRLKPKSKGNLHWASDSGRYRNVWVVGERTDQERLFRVYFGSWGRKARRSAYVVVFRHGNPQLEVRISPAKIPEGDRVILAHKLAFIGRQYKERDRLRDRALALARRGRVPVGNREAILGYFRIDGARLNPGPREVLRRILSCALVKWSMVEIARSESDLPQKRRDALKTSFPARERFKRGQRTKIDLLLDQRFEAHGRHNRLINRMREHLEAHGYQASRESPYDLIVRGKGRTVVVEIKAWRPGRVVDALRAATGQLLYYSHLYAQGKRKEPHLIAAIPHVPSDDLINFVEVTAGVGLIWSTAAARFNGGKLARRILPELFESS